MISMDLQALAPSQQAVTSMATNESDPLKKKGEAILEATVQANSLKIETKPSASSMEGKGLLHPSEKVASSMQANSVVSSMLDCVDESNGCSTTTTKTCSVKLVDISRPIGAGPQNSSDNSNSKSIGDAVKRDLPGLLSDEPNAKKARQSNPSESNRVLLKPKDFIDLKRRTVSSNSSNNHESPSRAGQIKQQLAPAEETSTSTEASKTTSESAFDNVEEELGRLFGSSSPSSGNGRKDTKVTISPVRLSSFTSSSSTSSSSSSSSAKESVITSSSSSSAPSLATSASSGGSVTITKLSTGSTLNVESKDLKTVLSANSGGTQQQPQQQQQQSNNSSSASSTMASLSTSKAGNVETSGLKLKSNIDIVSLSASGGSSKLPPQLSPPDGSSIKCNKCNEEYSTKEARRLHTCNSILDQHYLSVENTAERQANTKTTSSPNSPQSSSGDPCTVPPASSSMSSPSSFDSASSRSNSPMTDQMATNNKKPSAKLIKEKSDKLIIEGRPKLSVTKVPRQVEAISNCKPFVPKFKLSAGGDQCSLSNKANADNSANYSGKLKIKLQPEKPASSSVDTSHSSTSRPNSEQSGPEGGLAFSFAGKPTYSPSRASEPSNGAVPTKESPRDASNKDSPASQADSGVYSIASSSSPSKGDGAPTAESTSPESPNRDRMAYPEQNFNRDIQWKSGQTQGIDPAVSAAAKSFPQQQQQQQQPSSQSTATGTSAIPGPRAHHTMASSGSRPTVTPSLPSPSVTHNASIVASQPMPRTGLSHEPFVKPDSTHLHHQQMYQQQLQQQQQQQPMGWPGAERAQYPPQMPGNPQEMMQRQYSYSQNFFGFDAADGEPPKRKRGRPRKNPLKEPTTTKRKYTRKKPIPPQSASAVNPMPNPNVNAQAGFNNGLKNVMAAAHGDPSAAAAAMQSAANMGNYDPSVSSSPSVYNFDDEEEGGVQPMRPRRANLEAKKYAFGSSSDEDGNSKAAMMQQAGYPPHPSRINEFQMQMQRPMMRQQQQHMAPPNMMMMKNQQRMSMEMHHRMMSMQQQQQQQQLQSQQFQQQHYQQQQQAPQQPQRPTQQQQQQQQQQTQSAFNENQQGEEGLSYSSEVLTKPTGGIGIKIKIKKAADDKTPSKRSKREDEVPAQQQVGSQPQGPQSQVSQQQIPGPPQRQHHHTGTPNDVGISSSKAKDLPSIQQNNPAAAAAARSSQFPSQVPPMQQPMSSTTNTSVMPPSGSLSPAMNMMQHQQQQQQMQQQQMHQQQQQNSHGNIRPSNMFVGQQQQSMQRTVQNSPLQSGHTTPSPIRSPYNNTSPSPQHPGFGSQQQMNMNSFNRFQQPNSAGMVPGSGMNNYGYGMAAAGNYRMQNPQFMDGSNNFYNNHYINGGFAASQGAGNRFGHPNGQPYYNQMQQGNYSNGFNSGSAFGSGSSGNANDFSQQQQQSNEMYPNNFTGAASGNAQQSNRMLPPTDNNGGQPIPPHFRGNMNNMQQSPMGSPIGPPRISPSAMHKPMPGVGMPRASPIASSAVNNPMRQQTPLVSPQSMHSDHSASSPMHNNPLTPSASSTTPGGLPHGGITSPMYNTPRTPSSQQQQQHLSMMSPSPRSAQVQSLEQSPIMASSEEMKSPCNMQMLKSPLPYTSSNLRKIRRPSKPSNIAEEASPIAAVSAAPTDLPTASSSSSFFNPVKTEPAAVVKAEEVVKEEPEPVFEARWEELDVKLWKRIFRMCCENEGSSVPFLVRAQRVCSKWKEAATSDMSLWTHLDLSSGRGFKERFRNDKKLEWFLKKYPNVLELKLGMWKNSVSTSTIRVVAQYCPNLISLGLSGSFKLTNEDLKLIGDSFPKLQRIDLSGVSPSSSSSRSAVSSTCLTDFITVLGNRLTVLNISNNKMAGLPFVFKALSAHSVNLEVLDIANITTTSRDTININLEKFQKGCQKLRILNANQTMLSLTEAPVREQVNSPGFPNLEELHIAVDSRGYFDGMDDSQIERVLTKSAKLRVLDVRGCQHVSTSCLIRLKSWVIEKLVLAGCSATSDSSDSIEMLVQKFKCICDLDISLTTGERTVNNACSELADADEHKLRRLNLYSTSVSIKPLTRLLKTCHTLEYLNLASCRGLPRGIKRLYNNRDLIVQLRNDIADGKFKDCDNDDDDD